MIFNRKFNSFTIFLGLVFVNVFFIDILLIRSLVTDDAFFLGEQVKSASTIAGQPIKIITSRVCSSACVDLIKSATSSITFKSVSKSISKQTTPVESYTLVKEFYIPFGGGNSEANEWSDVAGIQAYIDTGSYPKIKEVRFEASVFIPTGNQIAYVRLFNVTDKHPVWFSEVSLEGGLAKLLISSLITLDAGNKLYQVQMKTSLQYKAILNYARVHIITY